MQRLVVTGLERLEEVTGLERVEVVEVVEEAGLEWAARVEMVAGPERVVVVAGVGAGIWLVRSLNGRQAWGQDAHSEQTDNYAAASSERVC